MNPKMTHFVTVQNRDGKTCNILSVGRSELEACKSLQTSVRQCDGDNGVYVAPCTSQFYDLARYEDSLDFAKTDDGICLPWEVHAIH